MSTEIEQLFGGANAEEQNALLHVIKSRGYDFLEKTPVTTMTVRLLEDLHKLGYKLVKNNDLLHDVSHSYYQVVFDGRNDDMQEVTAGLKTLEEAKQALEDNKKHFDELMYIIARINCG